MPTHRISLFLCQKPTKNCAIFVWIFTCMDFLQRLKPKFAEIVKGTTWNRYIPCLSLKPPKSFKPCNTIKTGFLVSFEFDVNSWGVGNETKTSRKRLGKPKKFLSDSGHHLCYFSNLFPVLFDRFVVFTSCMLHLEVSRQKRENTNPHLDGKFFVDLNGLGILRNGLHKRCSMSQ